MQNRSIGSTGIDMVVLMYFISQCVFKKILNTGEIDEFADTDTTPGEGMKNLFTLERERVLKVKLF